MWLNREQLRQRIEEEGLITNYPHLDTQLTPNGFDLTAGEIHEFQGPGRLDFSNSEREIPDTEPIQPEKKDPGDDYGWWKLGPGAYKVVTNERVEIPNDLVGISDPRSSLLRMGAFIANGFWEAGFEGTAEFLLKVENPEGIEIKENARVCQLAFLEIEEVEEGYDGRYKA
ncbi:MAG: deoxyuridine 5'-triphosphate nucleotidohydrolase [Candidatus Nanohaloarchaea archaeon]|nr:deoxyuridine 5'-triphosphate nucleotidohydrolase [Candidatus Nanohaloarchaea archaeon]